MNELPGLYLLIGAPPPSGDFRSIGGAAVRAVPGALVSACESEGTWLGVDGILTRIDRRDGETDADAAMRLYRNGGIEALRGISGYYTILLVDKTDGTVRIIPDFMATRRYYLYAHGGKACAGPDAAIPRRLGLSVTLDRQILYQMFRINHPIGGKCLAGEIERTRPFTLYRITPDGNIERQAPSRIEQNPDPGITLDEAADRMHEAASAAVAAILEHPLARSRELELPLTGGYDSRHLLGELRDCGRLPDRIRHIRVSESDYRPVEIICRGLGLDLHAPKYGELDHKALIRRWLLQTAGQVHLHQLYLFGLGDPAGVRPVLGLTAVLSGLLFSYIPLGTPIHRRHYTRTGLGLLFKDRARLAGEFAERIDAEFDRFEGEELFRGIAADAVNRTPRYAGAAFTELGEQAVYIAPAAERGAWEWFRTMPASLVARQKARIRLFERIYPDLGRFPKPNGSPLIRIPPESASPIVSRPMDAADPGARVRGRIPPTPHAWIRAHPILHGAVARVVSDSKLCADGHIPRAAARALWRAHRLGAYNGWALMSLVSTEAAYRILILGEDPGAVADWLTS